MPSIEFWPGLAQAWEATCNLPPEATQSVQETTGDACWRLIKTEDRVRVLWLEAERFAPLVFKIYRTPSRLAWRTIGLASRANREFTVMMAAHRLGLPIVRPRYWLEHRVLGCVRFSAIALDAIDGIDLESWLLSESGDQEKRQCAAAAAGRLIGHSHRAGLFLGTANPRNLLLQGGDSDRLCAIDLPYARLHDRDITGNGHAMADLGRALMLSNGQPVFNDLEREAFMLAYCSGDTDRAQALNAQLRLMTHKEWKRQRFLRRLVNLLSRDTNSEGRGGIYCDRTGGYHSLNNEAVFLGQPVD